MGSVTQKSALGLEPQVLHGVGNGFSANEIADHGPPVNPSFAYFVQVQTCDSADSDDGNGRGLHGLLQLNTADQWPGFALCICVKNGPKPDVVNIGGLFYLGKTVCAFTDQGIG